MELIRIGDGKLKVMLSADDMKRYEIDGESLDYEDSGTRRAFREILEEAKSRTGFDSSGDRVFIQVYPSRSGGCEMYVTKLASCICAADSAQGPTPDTPKKKGLPQMKIFVFGDSQSLLVACRAAGRYASSGGSAYYCPESGRYYLSLPDAKTDAPAYDTLREYGRMVTYPAAAEYLCEHCRCICESDALSRLGGLA